MTKLSYRPEIDGLRAIAGTAVTYIPKSAQAFDIKSDFMTCATLFWSDGDHWRRSGEARFGTRLLPALPQALH